MAHIFKKGIATSMTLSLMLAGQLAVAQTTTQPPGPPPTGGPPPNFAAHQQKELANIAQRIQILQTLQSCVQAATDHASIKACHETAKQSDQALHH